MIKKYFNENPTATITPWFTRASSFIKAICYDKRAGTLFVKITKVYTYQVTIDLADEFSRSSSWGHFYDTRIKEKQPKREVIKKPSAIIKRAPTQTPESTADWKDMGQMEDWIWTGAKSVLYTIAGSAKVTPIGFIGGLIGIELLDYFLASKGIDEPMVAKVALTAYTGYKMYGGFKRTGAGAAERGKEYFGSLATPYGSASYSAATGFKAKLTATDVAKGVTLGGKSWERMLTAERLSYGNVSKFYGPITPAFPRGIPTGPPYWKGVPMGPPYRPIGSTGVPDFRHLTGPITKTEETLRKINKYGDFFVAASSMVPTAVYLTYAGNKLVQETKHGKKKDKAVSVVASSTGLDIAIRGITRKR